MKNLIFNVVAIATILLMFGVKGCKKDKEDPTLDVSPASTQSFTAAANTAVQARTAIN